MAASFLRTGHKGSLEMNCLAGFIHARENAADSRKIIGPARILKSENIGQNPGIRRSICKKKASQYDAREALIFNSVLSVEDY